jgi:hypothetical protein
MWSYSDKILLVLWLLFVSMLALYYGSSRFKSFGNIILEFSLKRFRCQTYQFDCGGKDPRFHKRHSFPIFELASGFQKITSCSVILEAFILLSDQIFYRQITGIWISVRVDRFLLFCKLAFWPLRKGYIKYAQSLNVWKYIEKRPFFWFLPKKYHIFPSNYK